MMLAKDSYCHHFGSVTIKDEVAKKSEADFYLNGRRTFYQTFGIDPWGTGFCFDVTFAEQQVVETHSHVEILGINCGMGSNSLKIKEQLKEYYRNTDTWLYNITDDKSYLADLGGVSDEAKLISVIDELKTYLAGKKFHYVVWELPFLSTCKFERVFDCCWNALAPNGHMFFRLNASCRHAILKKYNTFKLLKNDWVLLVKR